MKKFFHAFLCFFIFHLFLLSLSSSASQLGDTDISNDSRDGIFGELDGDNNGQISLAEIREYVTDTGGLALDDQHEIQNAVDNVLFALDENEDEIVNVEDLSKYWVNLARLLITEEVTAWAEHALLLPAHIVARFAENGITGYDFPELLSDNGQLLEESLGIDKLIMKRRIMRGLRMKLLGMGQSPDPPNGITAIPQSCSRIVMKWDHDSNNRRKLDVPIHKYLIQRFDTEPIDEGRDYWKTFLGLMPPTSSAVALSPASKGSRHWVTVYDGKETMFEDHGLLKEMTYRYRLISWNAVGHSDHVYVDCTTLSAPCEATQTWLHFLFFVVFNILFYWGPGAMGLLFLFLRMFGFDRSIQQMAGPVTGMVNGLIQRIKRIIPRSNSEQHAPLLMLAPGDDLPDETVGGAANFSTTAFRASSAYTDKDKRNQCYLCKKMFKTFKRYQHYCCCCSKLFCESCGTVDHKLKILGRTIGACPIGGRCKCRQCGGTPAATPPNAVGNTMFDIALRKFSRTGRTGGVPTSDARTSRSSSGLSTSTEGGIQRSYSDGTNASSAL